MPTNQPEEAPPTNEENPGCEPQEQNNNRYTPIQYDLPGQDPQTFYGE